LTLPSKHPIDTKVAGVEKRFDEKAEEIKRHMDVVAEDLGGKIQQVAEGVAMNTQQLEGLQGLPQDVEQIRDDVEAIKVTLGLMKNDLKQKVDREEFAALEERVNRLEAKAR
jgi:archaellum component FlaC